MEMHHNCGSRCGSAIDCPCSRPQSPPSRWPWVVSFDPLGRENAGTIFCDIHSQTHHHRFIPKLRGKRFHTSCHGWLIFLEDLILDKHKARMITLWNPVTSKSIPLPPLRNYDELDTCCLSSPPHYHHSILFILRSEGPFMTFCRLRDTGKTWTEMSYRKHIGDDYISSIACYNGSLYAVTYFTMEVIRIQVKVCNRGKGNMCYTNARVDIRFLRCGNLPRPSPFPCNGFLTESGGEIFAIVISYEDEAHSYEIRLPHLFKLNFDPYAWEEVQSAKGRVFFLDGHMFSCPAVASDETDQGSYIHIIQGRNSIFTYAVEDKTMSRSFLPCPVLSPRTSNFYTSMWLMPESRSEGGDGEAKHTSGDIITNKVGGKEEAMVVTTGDDHSDRWLTEEEKEEEEEEEEKATECCRLVTLPLDVLCLIAEYCGVTGYLKFRAACKRLHVAVPPLQSQLGKNLRLQMQSLVSPWLMLMDQKRGLFTFTDPKFGDEYSLTWPDFEMTRDDAICSSRFGWLLVSRGSGCLVFLNPLRRAIIRLPQLGRRAHVTSQFASFGFSAPPTSPDCVVVGIRSSFERGVYITSPGKPKWDRISVDPITPYNPTWHSSPVFCGQHIFVGCDHSTVAVFKSSPNNSWDDLQTDSLPTSEMYSGKDYILECNGNLLSIFVGYLGQPVQVFKLDHSTLEWEQVHSLGQYMIFISNRGSFAAVAKTPGMENKIYFPMFYDAEKMTTKEKKKKNLVFYSLDTCRYHTFGKGKEETSMDSLHFRTQLLSVWIEPTWF